MMLWSYIIGLHANTTMNRVVVAFGNVSYDVNPTVITIFFPNFPQSISQGTLYSLNYASLFNRPGMIMFNGWVHSPFCFSQSGIDELCALVCLYFLWPFSHEKKEDLTMYLVSAFPLQGKCPEFLGKGVNGAEYIIITIVFIYMLSKVQQVHLDQVTSSLCIYFAVFLYSSILLVFCVGLLALDKIIHLFLFQQWYMNFGFLPQSFGSSITAGRAWIVIYLGQLSR